jgi:hypothetical protein
MSNDDDVDWIAFAALSVDDSIEPAEAMAGSMRDPEPDGERSLTAWIMAVCVVVGVVVGIAIYLSW